MINVTDSFLTLKISNRILILSSFNSFILNYWLWSSQINILHYTIFIMTLA